MKDYRVLKFIDRFKALFRKMGVDYTIMRRILQVKLLLDSRRTATVNIQDNKKVDKDKNNFLRSLPLYIFIGLFLIPFIFISDNYIFSMSIVFGIFMFMMMASLISDFSSVLLDVRDKILIYTKPVDSKTLNVAKILHICIYIFMITMTMAAPSLIASLFNKGIVFFLLYLFLIILVDLFIIMITALVYLIILKAFSGEKLKDIINYVQIGLTIFITIAYQLIGRVFSFTEIFEVNFNPTWWSYFLPPVWFASIFELLLNGNRENYIIVYSILAIVVPIISIILYIMFIPAFERNLEKLNQADGKGKRKNRFNKLISNIICNSKEERTFYNFASNIMKNERNFKLRVYPNLGFSLIFPFVMIVGMGFDGGLESLSNSKSYFSIYFTGFMITTIIQMIRYSGNYQGAWIYKFFTVNYDNVYKGTLKALFINLVTPVFIFVAIVFLFLFKSKVLIDLVIVYMSLFFGIYVNHKIGEKILPFSEPFGSTNKGGILQAFQSLLLFGVLLAIHLASTMIPYGKYIYLFILILVNKVAWKYGFSRKIINLQNR
ncbi:hypothetical protein GOQ29_05810 [Clostridium sp. D2Q-14]|uniref:hypothetical protein n=1 Tax=Anaeromonas gelatinilytica TaxID=2683194 RepID=UPI00193B13FA|nr:hypothetical protein [Anaeromonas gelatinilytica]MBS4535134.1 hypothetical protein [Anaeromonas gelatinilytica]